MSPPWQWDKETQATDDEATGMRDGRDDVPIPSGDWWQPDGGLHTEDVDGIDVEFADTEADAHA